ncbi:hypothetical protein C2845_PM14G09410 [Panicum miliaceum]|uniref:HVA22-like protein n=1 Tax=Panicum miliaceum TaxID=4540 RepID=A0A3L6PQ31_PANMI|nr:hypothetical protein C2845_PM14G09410 [Panicum miliaceum]
MTLSHLYSLSGYASVQAIESSSKLDDEQWLAYWILYSFITLMEMVLQSLICWIPIWYELKQLFMASFLSAIRKTLGLGTRSSGRHQRGRPISSMNGAPVRGAATNGACKMRADGLAGRRQAAPARRTTTGGGLEGRRRERREGRRPRREKGHTEGMGG